MRAAFLSSPQRAQSFALLLALLVVIPLLTQWLAQPFYLGFATRVLIFALAATALNLALGCGGMVSFGHAAFLGLGSYAIAILAEHGVRNLWLAWPIAIATAAALAALIGAISLRTRGVYFIMITLAFAQMLYYLAVSLKQYGGDDGLRLAGRSTGLPLALADPLALYALVAAVLLAALYAFDRLLAARFGHAICGIRENEQRMEALGYPVYRLKLVCFVLSGALAGLAGVLLANHNSYVSPTLLHWQQSGLLLVMVIVGGSGRVYGGLIGAAVILGLEEVLSGYTIYWKLGLGAAVIAVVLYAPQGIAAWFGVGARRALGATTGAAAAGATTHAALEVAPASDQTTPRERAGEHSEPGAHERAGEPTQSAAHGRATEPAHSRPSVTSPAPADLTEGATQPTVTLELIGLSKRYGGVTATDNVSLQVLEGELHALIGPNGAGKTTLIGQVSGALAADSGRVLLAQRDISALPMHERAHAGLTRSYQITSVFLRYSVLDNLVLAVQARTGGSFHFWRPRAAEPALEAQAQALAAEIGLAERSHVPAQHLSHGERRQLEVGLALAMRPRVLLLDEPMAGLGPHETETLIALLQRLKDGETMGRQTIVLVEHDMDGVFRLADRISVLVDGRLLVTGRPAEIRRDPQVIKAYLGAGPADAADSESAGIQLTAAEPLRQQSAAHLAPHGAQGNS